VQALSPKDYGLNAKVRLIQSEDHIGIVIDRKSRIIMKDGHRILDQAKKIRKTTNNVIRLYTSAPVCSKTKIFLNNANISITPI
jgi:hypothetical protein